MLQKIDKNWIVRLLKKNHCCCSCSFFPLSNLCSGSSRLQQRLFPADEQAKYHPLYVSLACYINLLFLPSSFLSHLVSHVYTASGHSRKWSSSARESAGAGSGGGNSANMGVQARRRTGSTRCGAWPRGAATARGSRRAGLRKGTVRQCNGSPSRWIFFTKRSVILDYS